MEEYTHMNICDSNEGVGRCRVLDCIGGVSPLKASIFEQMGFFAKAHALESQVSHT